MTFELTVTKKMASFTFYQNAMRASSKNDQKRYQEKNTENFNKTKKITPLLLFETIPDCNALW